MLREYQLTQWREESASFTSKDHVYQFQEVLKTPWRTWEASKWLPFTWRDSKKINMDSLDFTWWSHAIVLAHGPIYIAFPRGWPCWYLEYGCGRGKSWPKVGGIFKILVWSQWSTQSSIYVRNILIEIVITHLYNSKKSTTDLQVLRWANWWVRLGRALNYGYGPH